MGMSVGGPSGGIKSEINVTPLVDVVLVLLIIFMVITPLLQRGKSVVLPKASKVEEDVKKGTSDPEPLILSVTADKKMFLEQDEFDEAGLEEKLRSTLAYLPNKKILLKGDSSLTVGDVRKVMEVTRRAKAKKVNLGVEEEKK
jgi:biopolymer transport protein ExbD/biopolymer transport protein TolR